MFAGILNGTRSDAMKWTWNGIGAGIACLALGLAVTAVAGQSSKPVTDKDNLKIGNTSGGGQFAYGTIFGQMSKADAVVYMLHRVHNHFGDKPVTGKLLQSKDGNTMATFFTLKAVKMDGKPVAGLVMVVMHGNKDPQAAVLYDYATKFVSSEPSLLKALSAAWQGSGAGSAPGGRATMPVGQEQNAPAPRGGGDQQLYPATGGDRSALINLPPNWKIDSVRGGGLVAEGTHGEMMVMGMIYQNIIDPRTQQGRNMINGPMASRGPKVVCPLQSNLFQDFVCVFNQVRQTNGKSQGSFNFQSEQQQGPGEGSVPPIVALFTVDFHDGMGVRNGSARIGLLSRPGAALWAITVSTSNIPQQYASAGAGTLKRVVESYRQDSRVISAESAADMERIRQQGIRNEIQTKTINEQREGSKQAYESHMQALKANDAPVAGAPDDHNSEIDWQSKITQDYILDRSVVKDTDFDGTATVGNKFADFLVKTDPYKWEIVPNGQLVQGRDF
jgi:hypothetical protein